MKTTAGRGRCLAVTLVAHARDAIGLTATGNKPRLQGVISSLFLLGLFIAGTAQPLGQGAENLRDCPFHPGESPVTCRQCARARTTEDEDEECREAKAYILSHSNGYSAEEVDAMTCYWAGVVAANRGWKSRATLEREARTEASREAQAAKRKADNDAYRAAQEAKRQADSAVSAADQQGVARIREAMLELESNFSGSLRRSSSPGERAAQAEVLNRGAQEMASKARDARALGLGYTAIAAESTATRMRSMALQLGNQASQLEAAAGRANVQSQTDDFLARLRSQSRDAARKGLEDAHTGVADEYGGVVRDSLEEGLDAPTIPGRYAGERVREYLESATDHTGTIVPLANTAGS